MSHWKQRVVTMLTLSSLMAPEVVVMSWQCSVSVFSLEWRHNGHDGDSNHQPHDCLLNRLFRRRSKKTSKLPVTGLCAGNSAGTDDFPAQNGQLRGKCFNLMTSSWTRGTVLLAFYIIPLQRESSFIRYGIGLYHARPCANHSFRWIVVNCSSGTCAIHSLIFMSNLNFSTNGMAALLPMLLFSMTS